MDLTLTDETIMAIAQIAVALIGFSGVVVALGRSGAKDWTSAELLQLRTLVEPNLVVLIGAFAPFGVALLGIQGDALWRLANGVVLSLHAIGHSLFLMRGIRSDGAILISQKVVGFICLFVYFLLIGSIVGLFVYHQFAFLLGLLIGIYVSIHNFYLLLFGKDWHAT